MFKYSAFILSEGVSTEFEKTVESLRNLVGAEDLDIACLLDRQYYEMAPEVLRFIRKAEDKAVTNFTNASNAPNINKYFQSRESQIFFFLYEGDTADPYYLLHLENFFRKNSGVCSVAVVPVMNKGEDLSLASRQNTPDSELVNVKDDESISFNASYGVALWAQDAREAGLNPDPGGNGLKTMLDEMLKRLVQPKGIYGLINGVYHSREKIFSRKAMGIAEEKNFLVSCIIPVYNAEKYLHEAIDSVINQSIGFENNVELILVNDGSLDASDEICKEYQEKYPENIIYIEQENAGVSAARNAGLDAANGEFIAFLDDDDIYDEKFLEKGAEFLKQHTKDIDFVAFPIKLFGENVKSEQQHPLNDKFQETQVVDLNVEVSCVLMHVISTMISRKALKEVRFDEMLHYAEDAELLYRLLLEKPRYGISVESHVNYRKGHRESAITNSITNIHWYSKFMIFYRRCIENTLKKYNKVPEYMQQMFVYDIKWYAISQIPVEIISQVNVTKMFEELEWLLRYISVNTIQNSKYLSLLQKYYFLNLKCKDSWLAKIQVGSGLCARFGRTGSMPFESLIYIASVEEYSGNIAISGYFYSPSYAHMTLMAHYNDRWHEAVRVDTRYAAEYFLGQVAFDAYVFELSVPYVNEGAIRFYFYIDGYGYYPVKLSYTRVCRMVNKPHSFVIGGQTILLRAGKANQINVVPLTHANISLTIKAYVGSRSTFIEFKEDLNLLREYLRAFPLMSKRRIWLFMDRRNSGGDNAENLFRYSSGIVNDVEMCFVIDESSKDA
ncbi:MAG: glycosyltransferase family 2 protein, partial [Clostridiales bacterium]|nr:glycosyltransferase family 2 protein [Clostridiales bacterium]